ncbi:MAG: methionyl-tRNA formyltransferase, partial [Solirubrobacteraceae bacterium]
VCLSKREPIEPEDDYGSLSRRLRERGGELIVQALDRISGGEPLEFVEQDDAAATYAEKIGPEDRTLDPTRPPDELAKLVRALHPHIGARLLRPDRSPLRVLRARVWEVQEPDRSVARGALVEAGGALLFGARDGALELLEVQPPGGRPMDAGAYLRGHDVDAL